MQDLYFMLFLVVWLAEAGRLLYIDPKTFLVALETSSAYSYVLEGKKLS